MMDGERTYTYAKRELIKSEGDDAMRGRPKLLSSEQHQLISSVYSRPVFLRSLSSLLSFFHSLSFLLLPSMNSE